MEEEGFITTNITVLKGAVGNTEWWTDEDWENHRKNVEELKAKGEYLKPVDITVSYKPFPEFNGKWATEYSMEPPSFRIVYSDPIFTKRLPRKLKKRG